MILTGKEINNEVINGKITLNPFNTEQINPNSYNYRLGNTLKFKNSKGFYEEINIPEEGYVLNPGQLYLGHTFEDIGSNKYMMSLIGRSSMGRLGLFLTVSANLGHVGSSHKWTLELVCAKPIKLYPNMIIGQVSFWCNIGKKKLYTDGYSSFSCPQISKYEV